MKLRHLLLLGTIILFVFGCSSANNSPADSAKDNSETATISESSITYPLSIDSPLYDYATEVPNIIYTTSAEENNLLGNPYYVSGIVTRMDVEDTTNGTYFLVKNETGRAYFMDVYGSLTENSDSEEMKEVMYDLYGFGYDKTLPKVDENVTVYGLYFGYSDELKAPVFCFGLNENVQDLILSDVEVDTNDDENSIPDDNIGENITDSDLSHQALDDENSAPEVTLGQHNALSKAKDYLSFMDFSYNGLVEQLEYEGFTHEEAVYGADNCGADWNEQAAKKAKSYIDTTSFSKQGLIEQLEYEGFTHEQAVYGATQVGY